VENMKKEKKKDKERKRKKFSIPLFINMKNIFSVFFLYFLSYVLHSFCQQKKATNTSLVRVRGLSLIG